MTKDKKIKLQLKLFNKKLHPDLISDSGSNATYFSEITERSRIKSICSFFSIKNKIGRSFLHCKTIGAIDEHIDKEVYHNHILLPIKLGKNVIFTIEHKHIRLKLGKKYIFNGQINHSLICKRWQENEFVIVSC